MLELSRHQGCLSFLHCFTWQLLPHHLEPRALRHKPPCCAFRACHLPAQDRENAVGYHRANQAQNNHYFNQFSGACIFLPAVQGSMPLIYRASRCNCDLLACLNKARRIFLARPWLCCSWFIKQFAIDLSQAHAMMPHHFAHVRSTALPLLLQTLIKELSS